jgi:hypothetical protein
MTRGRDVDDLVARLRRFVELLIERDQARIGVHEDVTDAQTSLRDALRAALATRAEERAQ